MKRSFWRCGLTAVVALSLLTQMRSMAQQSAPYDDPTVYINPQQAASFRVSLSALSHEAGVTFIAENQPLHPTLLPKDAPIVASGGELLSLVVSRVAAAYDYTAERKNGIFILRKRYSDPTDLPEVTLTECAQSLDDLRRVTDALNPHLNYAQLERNEAIHNLLTSLTDDQIQMMHDKSQETLQAMRDAKTPEEADVAIHKNYEAALQSQGLPISTLSPEQQEAVRQIVLVVRVQLPTVALTSLYNQVREASQKDPLLCWRENKDHSHTFGYEVSNGTSGVKAFIPLTFSRQIVQKAVGSIMLNQKGNSGPVMFPDPSAPLPQQNETSASEANDCISLTQSLADLNARDAKGPKMIVDVALGPKHVTEIGASYSHPADLLQGLATVYGLRIRKTENNDLLLTRRLFRIPLDYTGLPDAIHNAFPDPLAQAIRSEAVRERSVVSSTQTGLSVVRSTQSLKTSALRILRTVAEPRIQMSKDGRVALSSLDNKANMALAVALMATSVEDLELVADQGVPEVISRFSEVCLLGGPTPQSGGAKFDLEIALPVAGGSAPPKKVMSVGNLNWH